MPARKRSLEAANAVAGEDSVLSRLRNMWQFANLCQWIYIFGKAAKVDESIDIEDIEADCLKPHSTIVPDVALALLKLISSHRGLTQEIFDDQARKQYLTRAPDRNPFGTTETPILFKDFDIFTKIRVLQQFTQWAMIYPERLREKMEEQKDAEQTSWRIEPYGWDSEDRIYYVLDDNRVYRLTEPPSPPEPVTKPKKKTTYGRRRSSKRRRIDIVRDDEDEASIEPEESREESDDGLGGMTWECLAITLDDLRQLLDGFRKTRDENEKILRKQLEDHLLPILEKQEESRKRKAVQRERELLSLAKMANAKRSSRIANKAEQQRQEEKTREEQAQLQKAEEARRREERTKLRDEEERDSRLASREQRLREREARRFRHEEELAQLSEDSRHAEDGSGRVSERRLQAEIERNRQALKELDEEDEDWIFDCTCGLYGQVDDGTHSVACENCNVWQHSKCLGISEDEADRPDFHFVCESCHQRKLEAAKVSRPRSTIKIKVNRPSTATASQQQSPEQEPANPPTLPANGPSQIAAPGTTPAPVGSSTSSEGHTVLPPMPAQIGPVQDSPFMPHELTTPTAPHTLGLSATSTQSTSFQAAQATHATHATETAQPTQATQAAKAAQAALNTSQVKNVQNQAAQSPILVSETPEWLSKRTQESRSEDEHSLRTPLANHTRTAVYNDNSSVAAKAGISPTKNSPLVVRATTTPGTFPRVLDNTVTLSPNPAEPILTPPTKQPDSSRPNGQLQQ